MGLSNFLVCTFSTFPFAALPVSLARALFSIKPATGNWRTLIRYRELLRRGCNIREGPRSGDGRR
jgi:hypothetical protein